LADLPLTLRWSATTATSISSRQRHDGGCGAYALDVGQNYGGPHGANRKYRILAAEFDVGELSGIRLQSHDVSSLSQRRAHARS
jgi:hypothetical protein